MMKPISPIYINVKGRLLDLATPQVMGILNVTPDSFYSGSRMQTQEEIAENANSEPFIVAESEAIETGSEVVESQPEKVAGEVVENDENVPDFMKD